MCAHPDGFRAGNRLSQAFYSQTVRDGHNPGRADLLRTVATEIYRSRLTSATGARSVSRGQKQGPGAVAVHQPLGRIVVSQTAHRGVWS